MTEHPSLDPTLNPALVPALVPALRRPPVDDVPASYARYARRELEREGIPMVLALHDARTGRAPAVQDETALAEGAALAGLFDAYEAGMSEAVALAEDAPGPDLTGGAPLITVLVVLAEEHLRARPEEARPEETRPEDGLETGDGPTGGADR